MILSDEGYSDIHDDLAGGRTEVAGNRANAALRNGSMHEREELALNLLASLPKSRLAALQGRIALLLNMDILGLLPDEIALEVLAYLPYRSLLSCSLVSRRWCTLTNDQSLWKRLCGDNSWRWRAQPHLADQSSSDSDMDVDSDDEGWGDEEDAESTLANHQLDDSGFASPFGGESSGTALTPVIPKSRSTEPIFHARRPSHHEYPGREVHLSPDYKLLHQTHIRIRNRIATGTASLSWLQNRSSPQGHTNTIYCLQLYTYPDGRESLFTGSKDRTVREWDLTTCSVRRIVSGVHEGSVLSLCVSGGLLVTGGSDRRVVVYDLETGAVRKVIMDHNDSVLCVRFDEERLVSCSKDRTVRTYAFPSLAPQHVLPDHRAAVNAIALSSAHILTASGDRSMRLYDAHTGRLLRMFDNHHGRGIASIDYSPPFVLSGSSDKHLRLIDVTGGTNGWSTCPEVGATGARCETCGCAVAHAGRPQSQSHEDLVRSVAMGEDFVVSGSYDCTVKIWDRHSGALVSDLTGGHAGRIFCVGFGRTKIVSCGEDQRICVWDFAAGFDTTFVE